MKKRSILTKLMAAVLSLALCTSMMSSVKITANAQSEVLTGKTATEIAGMMGKGWNLGNTFDATGGNSGDIYSYETSWGNPQVVKELIDGVKAAGYTTIRIPCTWAKHINKEDGVYTIDPEFLARMKEVIDWCYEDDLFVILNVHHEGWLNKETFCDDYEAIGDKLGGVWSVLAEYFKDYDQHLIFEGMNEPRAQGTGYEWTGNQAGYDAVNYLNQVFVNAVRGNGQGYNMERILGIPGYAASNSAAALRAIEIPEFNGESVNNVMISIHCYSPYEFCLTDGQKTFSTSNPSDTSDIKRMINDINTLFVANGIPAYIGECGATNSGDNLEARIEWFNYFGKITRENNIPAVVWDNGAGGSSGGECHKYFNRKTGQAVTPELSEAFIKGYDPSATAENLSFDFEPAKQGNSTVIKTPADLGFAPNQLMNQAKVNHTEDAAVGFSLKIAENIENQTAIFDLSRFAGNYIAVNAYVLADKSQASIGYTAGGDKTEAALLSANEDWQEVSFALKVEEGTETALFITGFDGETIYLDDMTIEMLDEEAYNSFSPIGSNSDKAAQDAVALPMDDGDDASFAQDGEGKSSTTFLGIVGIALAAICIICGLVLTIIRKKDK